MAEVITKNNGDGYDEVVIRFGRGDVVPVLMRLIKVLIGKSVLTIGDARYIVEGDGRRGRVL